MSDKKQPSTPKQTLTRHGNVVVTGTEPIPEDNR